MMQFWKSSLRVLAPSYSSTRHLPYPFMELRENHWTFVFSRMTLLCLLLRIARWHSSVENQAICQAFSSAGSALPHQAFNHSCASKLAMQTLAASRSTITGFSDTPVVADHDNDDDPLCRLGSQFFHSFRC